MQIIKIKSFIVVLSVLFLVGCDEQPLTKEYLLQHPRVLHKEYDRCQNSPNATYCDMVVESAQEFVKLSNELAENAQLFGQQIMKAEMQLAELQLKKQQAQGKEAIEEIEQARDAQAHHVKVLLAVVAEASSPGML